MKAIVLSVLINLITLNLFCQISPPEKPTGEPFADKNELPVLVEHSSSPTILHESETLTINIKATDDSEINKISLLWKQNTSAEWNETPTVNLEKDGEVYSTTIQEPLLFTGQLTYCIKIEDDETGIFCSEEVTLEVFPPTPDAPEEFQAIATTESTATLQWKKVTLSTAYIVEISQSESFESVIREDVATTTAEKQSVTFESLDIDQQYYGRIKAINGTLESEYSATIEFSTTQTAPIVNLSIPEYDFESKDAGETILFTFSVSATTLYHPLFITPPESIEISIDQINWYTSTTPLELGVNSGNALDEILVYCRIPSIKSGVFEEFITFSSSEMENSVLKIFGSVNSKTPTQSPTLIDVYCSQDEKLHVSWNWSTDNEIPENVLLMFIPSGETFSLQNGSDPTVGYFNGFRSSDDSGYFILSPTANECIIPSPPSGRSYQVFLVGLNGTGQISKYHTTDPIAQGKVVTRKNDNLKMWVNEIVYDPAGADTGVGNEKLEIYCQGILEPNKVEVVFYNGANNTVVKRYDSKDSPDLFTTDGSSSFLIVETPGAQNDDEGVALLYEEKLIEFISYEGILTAVDGPAEGMTSTLMSGCKGASSEGMSFQKMTEQDTDGNYWAEADTTWLEINEHQTITIKNTTTWEGTESSVWNHDANWSNGIPTMNSDVIIPEESKIEIISSDNAQVRTITLEPDAQIIGEEFLPSNTPAYIQRDFDIDRWSYFCSPVECLHADWLIPEKGVLYLIEYDNSQDPENTWNYITDQNRTLTPLQGYGLYNSRENVCFCFSGFFYEPSLSIELPFNDGSDNFSLVGNSFVSAIKWPLTNTKNITGSAYLYDPELPGYRTIGSDGVVTGNSNSLAEIPPLQGFFVETTAEAQFTLSFTDRVFGSEDFLKSTQDDKKQLKFEVDTEGATDYAIVYASENGELEFNKNSDSKKLFFYDYNVPQIVTYTQEKALAINHLKEFPKEIEFGIEVQNDQTVELTISNLDNIISQDSSYELLKSQTNEVITSVEGNVLKTTLDCETGDQANRYIIRQKVATNTQELTNDTWYVSQNGSEITINSKIGLTKTIEIFSTKGTLEKSITNPNSFLETILLYSGVYIIRWNKTETKKVAVR